MFGKDLIKKYTEQVKRGNGGKVAVFQHREPYQPVSILAP
jgi:hypothetical protein